MSWFGRKKEARIAVNKDATIEIIASKQAAKEVVAKANKINKDFNSLLVENGFTLKIYLATGGSHKPQTNSGKGTK